MTEYRRREGDWRDGLPAAALAAAVGLVVFYLARQWLVREPLGAEEGTPGESTATGRPSGGSRGSERGPGAPSESGT